MKKSITKISNLWPTEENPSSGIFIRDEIESLTDFYNASALVLSPVYKKSPKYLVGQSAEYQVIQKRFVSLPRHLSLHLMKKGLIFTIEEYLKSTTTDLLHFHFIIPAGLAVPRFHQKYPCVLTLHGSDWYKNIDISRKQALLEDALSATDSIICVGTRLKNDVESRYPQYTDKIQMIQNIIDTDLFKPGAMDSTHFKESLNWDRNKIHVLTVANMEHVKGIDVLVDAACRINNSDVVFHIIGSWFNTSYLNQIKKQITTCRKTNIHLYQPVVREQLKDYYMASDLFVLPSRSEGFGMALAEAQSCGVPAVSTNSGGPQEIVTKKTGLLVAPDSVVELVDGINYMIDNIKKYDRDEIHKHMHSKFHRSVTINKILAVYSSLGVS